MAFKLLATELKERAVLSDLLKEAGNNLVQKISEYNDALMDLQNPVEEALIEYNKAVTAVKTFCDNIAKDAELAIGDKSEKWVEGDKGQAAQEWQNAWDNADFEELEINFPEGPDNDIPDNAAILESLPEEMEQV